ncbi:MAG: UDP-N-acetylglucosamine 1-carboxyvinyltransferase [Myxococcaceae bacterium]
MDAIEVKGGPALKGDVAVSGAKNAALPILAASLLADGEHTFRNAPALMDVLTMQKLLRTMGCEAERTPENGGTCHIHVKPGVSPEAPYDLVKTMRASVLVLGPLVARHGRARVSLPGGCAIGARPIDQHLKALKAMGADIRLEEGYVEATAKKLVGARFCFDVITVTGTENALMAAVLAEGTTVLENAAREPEIEELARVLTKMGAKISGAGTDIVTIQGVSRLSPVEHTIVADRVEAGTLLVASALTRGDVFVRGAVASHLDAVLQKLREAGCQLRIDSTGIQCKGPNAPNSVDIETREHPGFPTDMQAQFMVLMSVASGTSTISENIFENRFMHVAELHRMGADIAIKGHVAIVKGVSRLSGARVMATDLRASASLVLAGLRADGLTRVSRVYHLDRGYEHLETKLSALGAQIVRVKD